MAKTEIETWDGNPVPAIRINIESAGTIGADGSHTNTIPGKRYSVSPVASVCSSRGDRDERHKAYLAACLCDHVIGFVHQTMAQAKINFDVVRLIHQNEIPEPPAKIGGGYLQVTLWHFCPHCGKKLKEIQPTPKQNKSRLSFVRRAINSMRSALRHSRGA